MRRIALSLVFLLFGAISALAQQVTTNPLPVYTANSSSTISVTATFQVVFANVANPTQSMRRGCTIQNNGTGTMWVYVHQQAAGTATKAASFQIFPPGTPGPNTFNCITGAGGVLQDQIDITGTAADTFAATEQ